MKVKDERGIVYSNVAEAFRANKIAYNGQRTKRIKDTGSITINGKTLWAVPDEGEKVQTMVEYVKDPLMEKLRERYTEEELDAISKGQGISKSYIPYPTIRLNGERHRIVVISDTHIGSVYSPEDWIVEVAKYVNSKDDVECVLHCGDLVDGLKIGRAGTQIYELSELGFDAQRQKAVRLMSMIEKPIYIISGNHDMYFREFAGANLVKAVCDAVPQMTYIGHDSADIYIGGVKVRLFHGGDGSSYALSYRLQKLLESYPGGEKPAILFAGHVHKFCYIFDRNVHAISCPCLQAQTSYMRAKKLAAHTGFLEVTFETDERGVRNLNVELFPFYA